MLARLRESGLFCGSFSICKGNEMRKEDLKASDASIGKIKEQIFLFRELKKTRFKLDGSVVY